VDIPSERVSVILNAVFQPIEPADPAACAELRARLGLPATAPVILHIGRNWYKNRETVLSAVADLRKTHPEVRLVMVGALTSNLQAQAISLGLDDALLGLDRVEPKDIATLYTAADVLFFPSHYEGFGLPVIEAQMCGTPVVCSDRGALPEVAGLGARIAPPRSTQFPELLGEALDEGRRAPNLAMLERFAAKKWFMQYREVYENVTVKRL
jgi:glycosyltransferase involved in cell wall biosynthesis